MKIKGKEVKFLYCIGADCEIDNEMQKVGAVDYQQLMDAIGTAKMYAKLGAIMSKWYCIDQGLEEKDAIREQEFLLLPAGSLGELARLIWKAIEDGQKQEIKTKSKNAKSAVK